MDPGFRRKRGDEVADFHLAWILASFLRFRRTF
jgi:hypothetical protein